MSTTVCLSAKTIFYPRSGGHLWVYLNWALGLRALGCRVIWMETVFPNLPPHEVRPYVDSLKSRLERYGLTECVALCSFTDEPLPQSTVGAPEAVFIEQVSHLQEDGWQVIDLLTFFLKRLPAPNSLPERTTLLTFDDGYRSTRTVALPWLLRFGYPAVFFVPTDFIGGRNTFDAAEPEEALCDWDDLVELERQGVSVRSHGASHQPFSTLSPAEQEAELRRSTTMLEAELGKRVEVFSYPYGDDGVRSSPYDRDGASSQILRKAREMLKRGGYRAPCLYGGGPTRLPAADPYLLIRLAVGPDTDLQKELREERSR